MFQRKKYHQVFAYYSGFGSLLHRLQCLHGGLARSLARLADSNPLCAARSVFLLSSSTHFILQACFRSSYLSGYQKLNSNAETTWRSWVRWNFSEDHKRAALQYSMVSYYQPKKRLPDNSSHLFSQPRTAIFLALDWASNTSLPYRTCACLQLFNRSHLGCILASNPLYVSTLESSSYLRSLKSTRLGRHYTPLDHLLNQALYADFFTLFGALKSALDRPRLS